MSRFYDLISDNVRTLGGYAPSKGARQTVPEGNAPRLKMASNENPFGPSPLAVAAMQATLDSSHLYPDDDTNLLREKLAEHHGVEADHIVVTAGSTSLLELICRTLLAPGLNAVTSERSFIVYPIAVRTAGGQLIEAPATENGFDLEAVLAAINRNTRLVFLANPNNPTGTLLEAGQIDEFLTRVPENVIVVLDEAYYDFAQYFAAQRRVEYSHGFDYVRQGRNVVVLRTFSKAHGLAGVRVGYGAGPVELMSYFARLRTTFSVSTAAQAGAIAALDDRAHILRAVQNNAEQSVWLAERILQMEYSVQPTWANFLYCELAEDASAVSKRLQAEGVVIRSLKAWGAPQAIRVTLGTPEQNQTFLRTFKRVVGR